MHLILDHLLWIPCAWYLGKKCHPPRCSAPTYRHFSIRMAFLPPALPRTSSRPTLSPFFELLKPGCYKARTMAPLRFYYVTLRFFSLVSTIPPTLPSLTVHYGAQRSWALLKYVQKIIKLNAMCLILQKIRWKWENTGESPGSGFHSPENQEHSHTHTKVVCSLKLTNGSWEETS